MPVRPLMKFAGVAVAVTAFALGSAVPAVAAPKPPTPKAVVTLPAQPVADSDNPVTVTVTGISRKTPVTVNWGDGSIQVRGTTCSIKKATTRPDSCTASVSYGLYEPGTYTVTVKAGKKTLASSTVTYIEPVDPWSPPPGWEQPASWATLNGGATYKPCSTVTWYYNPAGENPERSTMKTDIVTGLTLLAPLTGLKFVETSDPAQANMVFNWGDLAAMGYGDAEGIGGGTSGYSEVTFNPSGEWTKDKWSGTEFKTYEWTEGNVNWVQSLPGRAWLSIHETMHALGLGHVDDPAQVMYPAVSANTFGQGDIEGLATLYSPASCPAA